MNTASNAVLLYTAETNTTGGRDGASRSPDGRLDVRLSRPGSHSAGTNPEQLFAAGWSACFISAMDLEARKMRIAVPAGRAINAQVDLLNDEGDYFIRARLNVSLPGLDRDTAQSLINATHRTCIYSKATRGNIDVAITLV